METYLGKLFDEDANKIKQSINENYSMRNKSFFYLDDYIYCAKDKNYIKIDFFNYVIIHTIYIKT
jgi:hypothetical protein